MIERFVENIEKTIASSSIILSSNIQKYFSPDSKTVYIKGDLIFIDSSILEIAIFANESNNTLYINKYRFHYMDRKKQLVFRYDNAPHHSQLSLFPYHKHIGNHTMSASPPDLEDILNEISTIILKK